MIAVTKPTEAAFSIGTPEAIAMPIESGSATRKTTTDAKTSCQTDRASGAFNRSMSFSSSTLQMVEQ
jgi:hypothetical protein